MSENEIYREYHEKYQEYQEDYTKYFPSYEELIDELYKNQDKYFMGHRRKYGKDELSRVFESQRKIHQKLSERESLKASEKKSAEDKLRGVLTPEQFDKIFKSRKTPGGISPDKLANNILMILHARDAGYFEFGDKNGSNEKIVDYLINNRKILAASENNILLRQVAQSIGATSHDTLSKFINSSKSKIEQACFDHLGHPDRNQPVPKNHSVSLQLDDRTREEYGKLLISNDSENHQSQEMIDEILKDKNSNHHPQNQQDADNLMLRAMIHAGLINGNTDER